MTSALQRRRVFVDTAAFIALNDRNQADHPTAAAIHQRLYDERWQIFTSNFVLTEVHALALRRLGRNKAAQLLFDLDAGAEVHELSIVRVTQDDEARAREIIRQYEDKDFSLVDSSSFAVMERLEIPFAFTFDRHFEQYGLAVLTA